MPALHALAPLGCAVEIVHNHARPETEVRLKHSRGQPISDVQENRVEIWRLATGILAEDDNINRLQDGVGVDGVHLYVLPQQPPRE